MGLPGHQVAKKAAKAPYIGTVIPISGDWVGMSPMSLILSVDPPDLHHLWVRAGKPDGDQLAATGFGWALLELVTRGVGELQVRAPQLFHRVETGEPVVAMIDLVNEGTAELRNMRLMSASRLGGPAKSSRL